MARRPTWNVEPRPDGSWAVQRNGTSRADSLHETKSAAVTRGVELGRRHHGQVLVKDRNGRIQDERTYGADPYPPRG